MDTDRVSRWLLIAVLSLVTVIPVVPLDDAYVQALQTAHGHWGANAQD